MSLAMTLKNSLKDLTPARVVLSDEIDRRSIYCPSISIFPGRIGRIGRIGRMTDIERAHTLTRMSNQISNPQKPPRGPQLAWHIYQALVPGNFPYQSQAVPNISASFSRYSLSSSLNVSVTAESRSITPTICKVDQHKANSNLEICRRRQSTCTELDQPCPYAILGLQFHSSTPRHKQYDQETH